MIFYSNILFSNFLSLRIYSPLPSYLSCSSFEAYQNYLFKVLKWLESPFILVENKKRGLAFYANQGFGLDQLNGGYRWKNVSDWGVFFCQKSSEKIQNPFKLDYFQNHIIIKHSTAEFLPWKRPNELKIKLDMRSKDASIQQQQSLRFIVENNRVLTWNQIATEMNKMYPQKCRTGKQYRERYVNYVQFKENSIKNSTWTLQEQKELFRSYRDMGTKWTLIAHIVPSKSENSLKNKFYGALRKTLRKINKIGKQNIKKFNKFIRYESLIRIMDAAEGGDDLPTETKNNSIEIKRRILDMAENCEGNFDTFEVSEIIKKIHQFNIATRCYSSKKWKRSGHLNGQIKPQYPEEQSLSQQKSSKTCENRGKESSREEEICKPLQQERRLSKENKQNMQQVYQMLENELQIQEIKLTKINTLLQNQNVPSGKNCLSDDLDFELCGILHQNYEPQYFNYFEE